MDKDANPLPRNKSALGIQLLSNLYTLLQLDFTKPYREPLLVGAESLDKNKRNRIAVSIAPEEPLMTFPHLLKGITPGNS